MYPSLVFEPRCEKTPRATCKLHVRTIKVQIMALQTARANNKGADQPCSLINAFVVRYLETMIT